MSQLDLKDKLPKLGEDGQAIHVVEEDLRPGDVFLSYGDPEEFWLTRWVRILDDSWYSHVSFFDGTHSLDASLEIVVTRRPPGEIVRLQRYVDVFRFISDDGDALGSPGWDSAPVTTAGHRYLGHEYGTHDALLAAVLLLTRRVNLPGNAEDVVRRILSAATAWLSRLIIDDEDNELVTCSELPYRAYAEAQPAGKYRLRIEGRFANASLAGALPVGFALEPDGGLGYNVVQMPPGGFGDPELDRMAQQFIELYTSLRPPRLTLDLDPGGIDLAKDSFAWLGDSFDSSANTVHVEADFVSPFDLFTSPNLVEIGRAWKADYPASG